ncbi:MAG: RagB/SusD family nutrient uptake outer membrane protein [Bacteroidales bacterium]|nr:RagB/SusD family nutrient uptake outer membrane protein [Bacteroidales bacterium]
MKKIISTLLIAVAFVSCNNLDLEPTGVITKQQFFKTDNDALAAVTGIYQALTYPGGEQSLYGRNLYFLTDMGTDYAAAGASASNYHVQSVSRLAVESGNDRVSLAWKQIYNGVNRANIAIDNIPDITGGDPVLRERLANEAKFIRALLYFNAVRLWGDVPLVLHEAEELKNEVLKVGHAPKEEVYAQIISDLTDAQNLPATYGATDKGRPTSGAAKALLADVYLTRKEWTKARETAQDIIASASVYGYKLVDDFGELFTKPDKKNGPEHVFSVQFEDGQSGTTGYAGNMLPAASYFGPVAIEPADIPSNDEIGYNRFIDNGTIKDTRRDVSYIKQTATGVDPSTGQPVIYTFPRALFIKYVSDINRAYTLRRSDPIDFPLIRYSEVLLILAEALNEENGAPTSEAYEAINQVRRRAFGELPYTQPSSKSGVDLSGLDAAGFRKAIQDERLFEFVQEGKRWFDLVRWGILVEEVSKISFKNAVSERNYLYPIPQEQIDLNPEGLWQNPGY